MNYCPWEDRECILIDYVDSDGLGYNQICFLCGRNVRSNFPYQEK